ncbi:MAG: NAD-binding protein [Rhodothermales bacterium]
MAGSFRNRASRRLVETEPVKVQVIGAFGVLFLLGVSGTIIYGMLPGWSLLDGLYMTFITLTTIGFAEVHPLSGLARIFTIAISVVGVLTIGFIVARTTQLFVTGPTLKFRHMKRTIDDLTGHYIICGYGRLGQRIARDFNDDGRPFLVIENAPAKIEKLTEAGFLYLEGNAEEDNALLDAGIDRAHGIVTTLTSDSDNVFVTLLARELNPDIFILARTNASANARRLYRAGANKVISPYEIGADRMARVVLRPNVDRFLERALHVQGLDLQIEEIEVLPGSPLDGQTLSGAQFRQHYGAIVVGIVEQPAKEVTFNPAADRLMSAGDILIVIGDMKMIRLVKIAAGQPETGHN